MNLPRHIFFTGVPGSRWSGIAQTIETVPGMNTSDRTTSREFNHHGYTGHQGAYFGRGMEFEALPVVSYVDQAWVDPSGCKLVKSHDWAYKLNNLKALQAESDAWIMLVYRPDMSSYVWWHEVGGFNIKYPCYDAYKDSAGMLAEISKQNSMILEFGMINNCKWEYFTSSWIKENFNADINVSKVWPDILVTLIKNNVIGK
jgi:hypothetical protein